MGTFSIGGLQVVDFYVQMAAYLRTAAQIPFPLTRNYDIFWEGRVIATVIAPENSLSPSAPAIFDFDSINGLRSIWVGEERNIGDSVSFINSYLFSIPVTPQVCRLGYLC